MEFYKLEELMIEELGYETLYNNVSGYFGQWQMEDCLKSIANDFDIQLEEEVE